MHLSSSFLIALFVVIVGFFCVLKHGDSHVWLHTSL